MKGPPQTPAWSADPRVRATLVQCLVQMRSLAAPATPALIAALEDKEAVVQHHAATALGEIGPEAKAALEPLKKAMLSSDKDLVIRAEIAIRKINREK